MPIKNRLFEQIRLEQQFKHLYEQFGPQAADALIADSYQKHLARHEATLRRRALENKQKIATQAIAATYTDDNDLLRQCNYEHT